MPHWIGSIVLSAVLMMPQSFDVVSVKPSAPRGPGLPGSPPRTAAEGGRFIGSNANLRMLLQYAYRPKSGGTLRYGDIFGIPDWAEMQPFDIEAKVAEQGAVSPERMRSN